MSGTCKGWADTTLRASFVRFLRLFIWCQRLADRSVRPTRANLKAHQDWFRVQADAPDFFDALLDLIFQG